MARISSRPSISKRSGLRTAFSVTWTDAARPSTSPTRPQHSSGASRRAWSTIWS
jgi:hypothetical protein